MDAQLSFASLDFAGKKKRTKRDVFLAEMAAVVPWSKLEALIEPHYPKVGPQGGRRPFPIAVMLRIYCLQQWYNLSDTGAEEALYDIQSMRAFCHLELGRDPIPDETTILNFRNLLETHALTKAVFEAVADHLEARGPSLRMLNSPACQASAIFEKVEAAYQYGARIRIHESRHTETSDMQLHKMLVEYRRLPRSA